VFLTKTTLDPAKLRKLYETLDATSQAAGQEAVHADNHALDLERFRPSPAACPISAKAAMEGIASQRS
jgi:hypothetical protein